MAIKMDYSLLLANFLCLLEAASDSLILRSCVRANCPALRDSGWKSFSRFDLTFDCEFFGETVGAIVLPNHLDDSGYQLSNRDMKTQHDVG